jgi:superfamily I DNA/RNA helicase
MRSRITSRQISNIKYHIHSNNYSYHLILIFFSDFFFRQSTVIQPQVIERNYPVVRIRGLPYSANIADIQKSVHFIL